MHYAVVILRGSGSRGYIVMHRKAGAAGGGVGGGIGRCTVAKRIAFPGNKFTAMLLSLCLDANIPPVYLLTWKHEYLRQQCLYLYTEKIRIVQYSLRQHDSENYISGSNKARKYLLFFFKKKKEEKTKAKIAHMQRKKNIGYRERNKRRKGKGKQTISNKSFIKYNVCNISLIFIIFYSIYFFTKCKYNRDFLK